MLPRIKIMIILILRHSVQGMQSLPSCILFMYSREHVQVGMKELFLTLFATGWKQDAITSLRSGVVRAIGAEQQRFFGLSSFLGFGGTPPRRGIWNLDSLLTSLLPKS